MESFIVQQLVVSIVRFLRQQVETLNTPGSVLNEEGAESVEVALQCLEAAYNLSPAEPTSTPSLYNIFSNAVDNQASSSFMETESPSTEDKDEAEALKNEGNDLMHEKRFLDAVNSYTSAIEKDPANSAYYCNRAAAHSKLSNHQKAIADCKKALQIDPNRSKTYSRMGFAYAELNDAGQAQQCYKKASELDPENESYRMNLKLAEEKMQSQGQQPSSSGGAGVAGMFSGMGGFGPFASMAGLDAGGGGSSGTPNMGNLFNNPNLMSMASQLMTDPNMQDMLSSLFRGQPGRSPNQPEQAANSATPNSAANPPQPAASTPPTSEGSRDVNMDFLLNAGVQLAEQMQSQNPQLVEQLRSQLSRSNLRRGDNPDRNPPS